MGSSKRPNFLIVTASDLGFTDVGPYGSEIATPTLDRLAREGVTMTGFHTPSASSPTRAMLMAGTDGHIAGLGQMDDYLRVRKPYQGKIGYEGYLNGGVATLPEVLKDHGYHTIMSGKWHLGTKKDQSPSARGFDKSFAYLAGTVNHYNAEPVLGDLVDYLYRHPAVDSEGLWMHNDRIIDRTRELPPDFYSTSSFVDGLLKFLDDRNPQEQEKPFFAYLPFIAPHWPLQAPQNVIAKYRGVYDGGPDELRARRLHSLSEHGLFPRGVGTNTPAGPAATRKPATPTRATKEKAWSEMNMTERAHSSRQMETYAAMIDLIDQHLARVINYLEERGELDNTFVLFMSDNGGGEAKLLEALPIMAGVPLAHIVKRFCDNSTANIGNPSSFSWYGTQWSWASTAPRGSGHGASEWEGVTNSPCIVRYPALSSRAGGGGRLMHEFTTVMDILPTVLELAGAQHPGWRYRGREIAVPRGRSWANSLSAPPSPSSPPIHVGGIRGVAKWRVFGRRAVRRGKWKAVFIPGPRGSDAWELYDLSVDKKESRDLAAREPEVLEQLLLEWEKYYAETGMYDPAVEENVVGGGSSSAGTSPVTGMGMGWASGGGLPPMSTSLPPISSMTSTVPKPRTLK